MAKAPKTVLPVINRTLLTAIANATAANTFIYVTKDEAVAAGLNSTPPLIEVNPQFVDPNDANKIGAIATDAGKAFLATPEASHVATSTVAPSPYAIIKNATLPEPKKRFGGGGAPTVYPFETMDIGDSFFVPVSEKHPDPLKTLGSTVSSINHKYSVETGETKTVKRAKREGNKAVLGPDGKKIMEDTVIKVRKAERKFTIRAVENGKQYGAFTAPSDGVLIARVALEG